MIKFRKGFWILIPAILISLFATPTRAATYTVSGASDFVFEVLEPQQFTARAWAWQNGIDSMLWLYSGNQVIAANDDYYGLDSYISIQLNPGQYRLRAGVCCGNPDAWYGSSYEIETNLSGIISGPTTTSTTTTTTSTTLPPLENANWSMVNEGSPLELAAPDGYVFSDIVFASYGTPVGQNGRWEIGNCHSENSSEIVSSIAIGQSSFSVPATNDVFGDPCGGVSKRLAVTAAYAPEPTTTTTTSTTTTTTVPETTTTTSTSVATTSTTVVEPIVSTTTQTTLAVTTTISPSTTRFETSTTSSSSTTTTSSTTTSTTSTTSTLPTTSTSVTTTTQPVEIVENMNQDELLNVATNPESLKNITEDEAKQVFKELKVSEITEEEKQEITQAIQNAPDEVKQAFEEEINIYGEGFDNYVPVGSEIPVSERRTLIAVASIATAMAAVPGGSSPTPRTGGGAPSPNSNGNPPNNNTGAFKKDEEASEDDEEAPEIEGPDGDDGDNYTKNSIYKYTEDGMKKFSLWNFVKKFSRETASLAFTISSTVIVFATLSGDTRKITLIATTCAFVVHYIYVMIKNDE